jgi:hypothetical protein
VKIAFFFGQWRRIAFFFGPNFVRSKDGWTKGGAGFDLDITKTAFLPQRHTEEEERAAAAFRAQQAEAQQLQQPKRYLAAGCV